jgi:ferritin-like metal-binding protein YciE
MLSGSTTEQRRSALRTDAPNRGAATGQAVARIDAAHESCLVIAVRTITFSGGTLMANIDSLAELLQEELKDIYDAEKQLTKALPKLAKKATSPDLKSAFEEHLQQTEEHIERLEQVFEQLELPARGKKCEGMKHLISEGEEMMREAEDDDTRDALMIAAAQKVEHYEIASYGTIRTWANLLGKSEVASLLEETLEEEKETDQRLTSIAESHVNVEAANEGGEEEEEVAPTRRGAPRAAASTGRRQAAADRGRTATSRGRSKR